MKFIIVAPNSSFYEKENQFQNPQLYSDLLIDRGLLNVNARPCLSWFLDFVSSPNDVYIVCDAINYKQYERWALYSQIPLKHILNLGTTCYPSYAQGCITALESFIDWYEGDTNHFLIVSNLFLCSEKLDESLSSILNEKDTLNSIYYKKLNESIDEFPQLMYCHSNQLRIQFKQEQCDLKSLLNFMECRWIPDTIQSWEYKYASYKEYVERFKNFSIGLSNKDSSATTKDRIQTRSYARVGLVGNPSDGFYGKTIAFLLKNFWVEISLFPNANPTDETFQILSNNILDPFVFPSLTTASQICKVDGHYGVMRLFMATIKVFVEYCQSQNTKLISHGFKVTYTTNIPRQVGLSGSSAFVTALLKSLLTFYKVEIPIHIQANLALQAERDELGISAGHQDRVIQIYGGCVFMDFDKSLMLDRGFGNYTSLDLSLLPRELYIAYLAQPKESGKVHNSVKERFIQEDEIVVKAMKQFGGFAEQAKGALESKDQSLLASLMNANFNLRRSLYGDEVIGVENLKMIQIARNHGFACKFSGSGGCIIILWSDVTTPSIVVDEKVTLLKREMLKSRFVFVKCQI